MEYGGYRINEKRGSVIVEGVDRFDPVHVFECGQCFRWHREDDGSYTGIAMGRVVNIKKTGHNLIIRNASVEDFKNTWYHYFDLARNYSAIIESVSKDDIMKKAVEFGQGIRILRQDFFETLISYIISANNSIPRIRKIISVLSEMYGRKLYFNGSTYYTFPQANELAKAEPEELKECRGGYRCRYVIETARMYEREPVDKTALAKAKILESKKILMRCSGVGEKVAECTLLYSGTRYDVFPTDVWVRRVMEELYFRREASAREIHEFARLRFGELSGFAQQYLFFYAREKRIGV
jgi:N-glycosylase/DNA lyase